MSRIFVVRINTAPDDGHKIDMAVLSEMLSFVVKALDERFGMEDREDEALPNDEWCYTLHWGDQIALTARMEETK